jgi:hypothetical protein
LTLNRFNIKYVPNSKLRIEFPSETIKPNQYVNEYFTIWQYQQGVNYSCFYFDDSGNNFSEFISESPSIKSSFTIDSSANIIMRCTTPGYTNNGINDFYMNVPSGTYNTLTQYLSAITTSFQTTNTTMGKTYFNTTNTKTLLDSNNTFNLQIDVTKPFTNSNYKLVIDSNSFLTTSDPSLDISYSFVLKSGTTTYNPPPTNLNDISNIIISMNTSFTAYQFDTSGIFDIYPDVSNGDAGNGDSDLIPVSLDSTSYLSYNGVVSAIQRAITTTKVTNNINTQTPLSSSIITTTNSSISINLNCYYHLSEANYDISFVDGIKDISDNAWTQLGIYSHYDLSDNLSTNGYALIKGYDTVGSASTTINIIDNCNNTITFTTNNSNAPNDTIVITIPPNIYTLGSLYSAINTQLNDKSNPKTQGSYISLYNNPITNQDYTQIWININNIYTTQDYVLDFYDPTNFATCNFGSKSIQNTTWDTTIGWMLGFRDYTQYFLTPQNQTISPSSTPYYLSSSNGSYTIKQNIDTMSGLILSTIINLTGDTTLSTNLYNYFLISLDDFIQNHLNDGLVTITRNQTAIQLPDYSYSTTQTCDPATGELSSASTTQSNSDNVTNAQLYALNQSISSQQNPSKQYSPGPFIKDLFGIIPYKPPGATGDYYTEFGGSLQNQERLYFGPVNIRKMSIQLLTDRGTTLDLNGSNWSFSFICQQLYRSTST